MPWGVPVAWSQPGVLARTSKAIRSPWVEGVRRGSRSRSSVDSVEVGSSSHGHPDIGLVGRATARRRPGGRGSTDSSGAIAGSGARRRRPQPSAPDFRPSAAQLRPHRRVLPPRGPSPEARRDPDGRLLEALPDPVGVARRKDDNLPRDCACRHHTTVGVDEDPERGDDVLRPRRRPGRRCRRRRCPARPSRRRRRPGRRRSRANPTTRRTGRPRRSGTAARGLLRPQPPT